MEEADAAQGPDMERFTADPRLWRTFRLDSGRLDAGRLDSGWLGSLPAFP
jgi:hypothetical protein